MADPESCLQFAISTVSIHANSVWWHQGQDSYRLANLSLWLDYLRSKAPDSSPDDFPQQSDESFNRGWKPPQLQEIQLPEALASDPEAWLRGHAWPTAIARNFPAISAAVSGSDRTSLFQYKRMYEANQPYKIETFDEMKLYRKISKDSIKKIWAKPEPTRRKIAPSLNANVPEFYPSVLFHHVDIPQSYPPITDLNYHMDISAFHEQNAEQDVLRNSAHVQVFPNSYPEHFGEIRSCANPGPFSNLLLLQKTQKGHLVQSKSRGSQPQLHTSQRSPFQNFVGQALEIQPHILLNSDFPELPSHRGNEPSTSSSRRPGGFQDNCTPFSGKSPEEIEELNRWLHTAYPQRAEIFAELEAAANALNDLAKKVQVSQAKQEHPRTPPSSISEDTTGDEINLTTSMEGYQESRRLYRDVVAFKADDDSETAIEGKFEELEREAMEQYISSENSGEVVELNESIAEIEDPYQDLERQAVEQYEENGDIDECTTCNSDKTTDTTSKYFYLQTKSNVLGHKHSPHGCLQMDGGSVRKVRSQKIRLINISELTVAKASEVLKTQAPVHVVRIQEDR